MAFTSFDQIMVRVMSYINTSYNLIMTYPVLHACISFTPVCYVSEISSLPLECNSHLPNSLEVSRDSEPVT